MTIHSTRPKTIHLVQQHGAAYDGKTGRYSDEASPAALCGTPLPITRVEVVLPHDDPKACRACLEKHAEDKADPHAPLARVPSPQMW